MGAMKTWMGSGGRPIIFPAGIILPFNGEADAIHNEWELFLGVGNRSIKAVGSGAGEIGGTTSVQLPDTSIRVAHTDSATPMARLCGSNIHASSYAYGRKAAGSHYHSAILEYMPDLSALILVKSRTSQKKLPANTGLLSLTMNSKLTDITPVGGKLLAGTVEQTGHTRAGINRLQTSVDGSHYHHKGGGCDGRGGRTSYMYKNGSGDHFHEGEAAVQDSIRRFHLAIYTNAVKDFKADGKPVAMWESNTPPENWAICNGHDNTPDLTNHFIGFDPAKTGTSTGDGTISSDEISTSMSGGHNHQHSSTQYTNSYAGYHATNAPHDHIIPAFQTTFEPEFYTLIFITPKG